MSSQFNCKSMSSENRRRVVTILLILSRGKNRLNQTLIFTQRMLKESDKFLKFNFCKNNSFARRTLFAQNSSALILHISFINMSAKLSPPDSRLSVPRLRFQTEVTFDQTQTQCTRCDSRSKLQGLGFCSSAQ